MTDLPQMNHFGKGKIALSSLILELLQKYMF